MEQKIGEEAAPVARRDESGPITLFGTAAASRREPTGELGAAALDRAASEARAAADAMAVATAGKKRHTHTHTHTHTPAETGVVGTLAFC